MPGITGAELGEIVREKWSGLRILLVSGYPNRSGDLDHALPKGDLFLQKPFRSSDLIDKLHELLELEG